MHHTLFCMFTCEIYVQIKTMVILLKMYNPISENNNHETVPTIF